MGQRKGRTRGNEKTGWRRRADTSGSSATSEWQMVSELVIESGRMWATIQQTYIIMTIITIIIVIIVAIILLMINNSDNYYHSNNKVIIVL